MDIMIIPIDWWGNWSTERLANLPTLKLATPSKNTFQIPGSYPLYTQHCSPFRGSEELKSKPSNKDGAKGQIEGRIQFSSVQFSHSVVSDSLRTHELQHARPPCPSPTPGVYPNPCPLSRRCHPTISSSAVPFSSSPQSFPASGCFQ